MFIAVLLPFRLLLLLATIPGTKQSRQARRAKRIVVSKGAMIDALLTRTIQAFPRSCFWQCEPTLLMAISKWIPEPTTEKMGSLENTLTALSKKLSSSQKSITLCILRALRLSSFELLLKLIMFSFPCIILVHKTTGMTREASHSSPNGYCTMPS